MDSTYRSFLALVLAIPFTLVLFLTSFIPTVAKEQPKLATILSLMTLGCAFSLFFLIIHVWPPRRATQRSGVLDPENSEA